MKAFMDIREIGNTRKFPFALSLSKCPSILSLSKGLSLSKCPSILSLSKGLSMSKSRSVRVGTSTGSARTGGGGDAKFANLNPSRFTA